MPAREIAIGRIAVAGGAIALTVVLVVAAVLGWLHWRDMRPGGERLRRSYDLTIAGPTLDTAPQPQLRAYQAEKAQRLHGWGWVDAPRGIVHIPIENAMALMVERAASAPEAKR